MVSYCLYCQTLRCQALVMQIELRGLGRALSPKQAVTHRKAGKLLEEQRDLLPGYLFLFKEEPIRDAAAYRRLDGVVRFLGSPANGYVLFGEDEAFAKRILEKNGVIGHVPICRIGGQVRLLDPLFSAHQGEVIRVDGRKHRAEVKFVFHGEVRTIWVSIEELKMLDQAEESAAGG